MEACVAQNGQKLLDGISFCVVYGQADYTARLTNYLEKLSPQIQMDVCSFPLQTENVNAVRFDFCMHDADLGKLERDSRILVAFSSAHRDSARRHLQDLGFTNLLFYDAKMDNELKQGFFQSMFREQGRDFSMLRDAKPVKSVAVYMAKHVKDKPIADGSIPSSPYLIPIQVGAALTDQRIADVADNTGDNISDRNRRYSEMTAFYWMWKNATADYLGICHYRRLWVDLDGIVEKLQTTDVDAVLPLPTLCEHSVHEDYLLKYIPDVWQPMMEVMREQSPEYYAAAQDIFQGRIFYACNMCILRREVLDDLCSWMFPIVMEVENRVGDLEDPYFNRYAGFCTERLITLYFLHNMHHWKIAHAEKVFIA